MAVIALQEGVWGSKYKLYGFTPPPTPPPLSHLGELKPETLYVCVWLLGLWPEVCLVLKCEWQEEDRFVMAWFRKGS